MVGSVPKVIAETPRLILREMVPGDFAALHALFSCPEVMRFSLAGPLTEEQTRERLAKDQQSYAEHGYGKWAVVLKETGEMIGICGVSLTSVDGPPAPELGYRLIKSMWGKGYAVEAGRAALAYCWQDLKLPELVAFVEPANGGSIKVLEKLGFVYQREAPWHGRTVKVFRVGAGEF